MHLVVLNLKKRTIFTKIATVITGKMMQLKLRRIEANCCFIMCYYSHHKTPLKRIVVRCEVSIIAG